MDAGAPRAVSPVVGALLMLAVVVGVIAVIFAVAVPQFRRLEARSQAEAGEAAIDELAAAVSDVALTASGRSKQAHLDVPDGGLTVRPNRTRWAVWSSSGDPARWYNLTLDDWADGDGSYVVRTEHVDGVDESNDTLRINHTRWRDSRPTELDTVTGFDIPDAGSTATVSISQDLAGGLHEIVFFHPDSGTEMATAWVMDSASVLYEGDLYTGPHRYELLGSATVDDEPATDPRIDGLDVLAVDSASPTRVTWTSVRLELGPRASPSIGAGPVVVPMRSSPAQALFDGRRANATVAFHGAHADRVRDAAINGTAAAFHAEPPRGVVEGPVDVAATDHRVLLPEGLVRR